MGSARPFLAVVLIAACAEKIPEQKPTPPDMTGLLQAYEHPTLTLNQQTMPELAEALGPAMAVVDKVTELVPLIQDAIEKSARQASEGQSAEERPALQVQAIEGEGFALVDRICPGWEQPSRPDPANGYMHLTVGFTGQGIDPVAWGTFAQCKIGLKGLTATLDGSVSVAIGTDSLKLADLKTHPEIWQFNLTVTALGGQESWGTDFRVDPSGALQFRVFVGDRFAVYFDQLTERGFLADNGRFLCEFDDRVCISSDASLSW